MRFTPAAWMLVLAAAPMGVAVSVAAAAAADGPTVSLVLKDHRFTPSSFSLPAGQKAHIVLTNQDPATEEFDSHDLQVEELVTPHGRASFTIGPLKPGTYSFMGEFHPATAQGRVTVTEAQR
ncbi:MAG TPA: cupredoxin domain-containing protein [Caulobacteraceae bacterium]